MTKEAKSTVAEGTRSKTTTRRHTFLPIRRTWPTTTKSSGPQETSALAVPQVTEELKMLDRWLAESQREAPWNNIAAVAQPPPNHKAAGSKDDKGGLKK
jgi:hypothetical protein